MIVKCAEYWGTDQLWPGHYSGWADAIPALLFQLTQYAVLMTASCSSMSRTRFGVRWADVETKSTPKRML